MVWKAIVDKIQTFAYNIRIGIGTFICIYMYAISNECILCICNFIGCTFLVASYNFQFTEQFKFVIL